MRVYVCACITLNYIENTFSVDYITQFSCNKEQIVFAIEELSKKKFWLTQFSQPTTCITVIESLSRQESSWTFFYSSQITLHMMTRTVGWGGLQNRLRSRTIHRFNHLLIKFYDIPVTNKKTICEENSFQDGLNLICEPTFTFEPISGIWIYFGESSLSLSYL